jgi:hypothetical protein
VKEQKIEERLKKEKDKELAYEQKLQFVSKHLSPDFLQFNRD